MKFLILISTIFVMSCSNYTEEMSQAYELPEELKDCKVYWIAKKDNQNGFKAMRCPLSSTSVTYSSGKHTVTTITTEDSIQTKTEDLQKQLLEIQSKLNEIKSR